MHVPEIKTSRLDVPWHGLIGDWRTPMTKEQTGLFLKLMMLEMTPHPEAEQGMHTDMMKNFQYQVMTKRFEVIGAAGKFHVSTMLFVITLCENVADVVMWAYTLNYIRVADKLDKVGLQDVASRFPWGFPTESERHAVWLAQKREARAGQIDNMVDVMEWPNEKTAIIER